MKTTAIATTIISALLLGGVLTACNQASPPNSSPTSSAPVASTTPQVSSSPTATPLNKPQANSSTTPGREQRREARRKEIEAVLTPDQVQQLQAKLKQGEKLRNAIASLDLTADQKAKIQIIMEKSYEQTPHPSTNKSPQ